MYTFQPNLRSITRIFSADYAENKRIRKRYNEHFMEINVLAHSGDVSSLGGDAMRTAAKRYARSYLNVGRLIRRPKG